MVLTTQDAHMQRFLWRDCDPSREPQTYVVKVNNFEVKSANCIATCALHKSADMFADTYPEESKAVKEQTYIDDELTAAEDKESALLKTKHMDEICEHAGMPNKGWTFSGDSKKSDVPIGDDGSQESEKVLGMSWDPESDMFKFNVKLKLHSDHD